MLDYTFDEIKMNSRSVKCKDSEHTGLMGQNGKELPCSELTRACDHPQYSRTVKRVTSFDFFRYLEKKNLILYSDISFYYYGTTNKITS